MKILHTIKISMIFLVGGISGLYAQQHSVHGTEISSVNSNSTSELTYQYNDHPYRRLIMAYSQSQFVGYIVYECSVYGTDNASIEKLYVNLSSCKKGIATELVKRALADITERSTGSLIEVMLKPNPFDHCSMTQEQLIAFYEKCGATISERHDLAVWMKFIIQKTLTA